MERIIVCTLQVRGAFPRRVDSSVRRIRFRFARCCCYLGCGLAVLWVLSAGAPIAANDRPKPFYVSTNGRAGYSTIQEAINAAPENGVVQIGPGTFEGPVQISKPLTLEGAGANRTFLTNNWVSFQECLVDGKGVPPESQERYQSLRKIAVDVEHGEGPVSGKLWQLFGPKPTLTVKNTHDVVVRGISISMPGTVVAGGSPRFHMAMLENAAATVEGCAFVGSAVDGVNITGDSIITMQKCLMGGIRSSGIVVNAVPGTRVKILDCDVRGCGYAGISIKGEGDVTVADCRISKTEFHGIRYDDASPMIKGNVLSQINRAGIYVGGKTKGVISDNVFIDCSTGGNEDLIANNTFVRKDGPSPAWQYFSAISVSGSGAETIRDNVISGFDYGVIVHSSDKKPLQQDAKQFEGNVFDTIESAIVNVHSVEPKAVKQPPEKPELHELPIPDGNWQKAVMFNDPARGDYAVSRETEIPNRIIGSRKHASVISPWPEHPAERAMQDQIKDAEAKQR